MSTHHHLATRVNRVFLDFENVVKIDPKVVSRGDIYLTVFRGAHQSSMRNDAVDALLGSSNSPKIVDVVVSGKNALDFVLASYVGYVVRANPGDYFHIISKDTGYDALIKQLRKEHIRAFRRERFEDIPSPGQKKPSGTPDSRKLLVPEDRLTLILKNIGKNRAHLPAKKKTLLNYLKSQLGLNATADDVQKAFDALCSSKTISIGEKNSVTYLI